MTRWTTESIPAQHGRLAIVTGTGGLGYEDALALARAGGDVILAGRNAEKGAAAVARVRAETPAATIRFELLDLADLASITAFGARMRAALPRLDLLINNAAVMAPPDRQVTSDGFELQFGTNHLGHFALTAALLPLLRQSQNPRVISVASLAARSGTIDFDDLQAARRYRPMAAYGQSKLANILFALELQRRSDAAGWGLASIAAHPGISHTDLITNGVGHNSPIGFAQRLLGPVLFQPAAQGALPTLFAATAPDAAAGGYYGPDGLAEMRGFPGAANIPPQAADPRAAARLWEVSAQLSGATFG